VERKPNERGGGGQLTIIKHKISSGPRLAPAALLLWLWTQRKMYGVAAWVGSTYAEPKKTVFGNTRHNKNHSSKIIPRNSKHICALAP
jgi:hypothetical protein